MRGYDDASYGDAFADVYDEWYDAIGDLEATVATLAELASGGRVLELGVGTGRLAVPLAARGLDVTGIDSSAAMLDRLAAKADGSRVHTMLADMVDGLPRGPFDLAVAAYNTLFNLRTVERQQACFVAVARVLSPRARFVVEAFVPDPDETKASSVTVRSLTADRVVLSVSTSDAGAQTAEGQYVDISEARGIRLRPWAIRWATPAQLDAMAAAAGLRVDERWSAFDRSPFTSDSTRHVSVYRN